MGLSLSESVRFILCLFQVKYTFNQGAKWSMILSTKIKINQRFMVYEGPGWQTGNTRLPRLGSGFGSQHDLKWECW